MRLLLQVQMLKKKEESMKSNKGGVSLEGKVQGIYLQLKNSFSRFIFSTFTIWRKLPREQNPVFSTYASSSYSSESEDESQPKSPARSPKESSNLVPQVVMKNKN